MDERNSASFGPRNIKKKGSTEWCWQTVSLFRSMWESKTIADQHFRDVMEELVEYKVFEKIPPEHPYGSLDSLLKTEIGVTSNEIEVAITRARERVQAAAGETTENDVLPVGAPEGNKNASKNNSINYTVVSSLDARAQQNGISRATQNKLDHLARNRPDLLEHVKTGELSADKAYKIARGIKDPTPLDKLKKEWRKASYDEKITFLEWVETANDSNLGAAA